MQPETALPVRNHHEDRAEHNDVEDRNPKENVAEIAQRLQDRKTRKAAERLYPQVFKKELFTRDRAIYGKRVSPPTRFCSVISFTKSSSTTGSRAWRETKVPDR
jgi:hypothetical protein